MIAIAQNIARQPLQAWPSARASWRAWLDDMEIDVIYFYMIWKINCIWISKIICITNYDDGYSKSLVLKFGCYDTEWRNDVMWNAFEKHQKCGTRKNMFRPGLINWGALCQLSAVRSAVSFFVRVALDLLLWLWLSFCCGLLTHLWLSFCFELLTHLWLSFCFGLLTHLWLRFWFRTCRDLSFLWQPHNKPKDFNISIAKQQRT